jgi:hypothetical protein
MRKRPLAVAVALFVSHSVFASRFDVISGTEKVAGAEVCFFTTALPPPAINAILPASPPRCQPADADVSITDGVLSVFARKGRELISERTYTITARDESKRHELRVVPASTLDLWPAAEDEVRAVVIARTGAVLPLDDSGLAPAGVLVPLSIRKNSVTMSSSLTAAAGEHVRATRPSISGLTALITPRSIPEGRASIPEITAVDARGRTRSPLVALPSLQQGQSVPLLFAGLADGKIIVGGERWRRLEVEVSQAAAKPIVLEAISRLAVSWWTATDLASLRRPQRECDHAEDWLAGKREEPANAFQTTLMRCRERGKPKESPDEPDCVNLATRELPLDTLRGELSFEDVPAGQYTIVFRYFDLPQLFQRVTVKPAEQTGIDVQLRYATFFGKVTRAGKPVKAALFDTVSDDKTGDYFAVLPRMPMTDPQVILPCDGSSPYRFVPDPPPAENTPYDVEIPENRILIQVTDKQSGLPIPKALINFAAIMPNESDASHWAGRAGVTDDKGSFEIAPVIMNRTIKICARHTDYESICAEPFTMKDVREKRLELALAKAQKLQGRVLATGPISLGQIVWVGLDGQIAEMVREISEDGSFIYYKPHGAGETVVFSAANQPLYVFKQPAVVDGEPFVITVPNAPRRTFTVTLSSTSRYEKGGHLGLSVGGLAIANPLGWHMMRRRTDIYLYRGGTVTITDILETGPIEVILVPIELFATLRRPERVEITSLPEAAQFPRRRVVEGRGVLFE